MTLDAPRSDAELLELHRQRTSNGVALGPRSPVIDAPERPSHRARKGMGRKRRQQEHEIQREVFDRVRDVGEILMRPALALVFAVPNGGHRMPGVAAKLKAEGVVPGPPDVWCPVARGGYHGLVIEIKTETGTLRPEQADWLHALAREGWKTAVHTTSLGVWAELTTYLDNSGGDR